MSPFPPKVNMFKSETTIIQERQSAFEVILNEMFSDSEISESFPLLYFFKVKDQVRIYSFYRFFLTYQLVARKIPHQWTQSRSIMD